MDCGWTRKTVWWFEWTTMIWSTLPQQSVSERESSDYLGNAINKEARLKHVFFNKMQEIRRACFEILLEGHECEPKETYMCIWWGSSIQVAVRVWGLCWRKLMLSGSGAWGESSKSRQLYKDGPCCRVALQRCIYRNDLPTSRQPARICFFLHHCTSWSPEAKPTPCVDHD